jgi:hypothetical protein
MGGYCMEEQRQMRIGEKIITAVNSVRIEWLIIGGVIFVIIVMLLIIYNMGKQPGELSNLVISKMLDYINTLIGALIAWGTTFLGAMAAKIRNTESETK